MARLTTEDTEGTESFCFLRASVLSVVFPKPDLEDNKKKVSVRGVASADMRVDLA